MDFGFKNSADDDLSPCKPDRADSLQGTLRSWERIRCHGSEEPALGQRCSCTAWSNGFAKEDFLCVSPMVPDGVLFSHIQAGRNSTEI